jgi:hypothetical protein
LEIWKQIWLTHFYKIASREVHLVQNNIGIGYNKGLQSLGIIDMNQYMFYILILLAGHNILVTFCFVSMESVGHFEQQGSIQLFQLRLSPSKVEKSNANAKGCFEPL